MSRSRWRRWGSTRRPSFDQFNDLFDHVGVKVNARKTESFPENGNGSKPAQGPEPEAAVLLDGEQNASDPLWNPEPEKEPIVFDNWKAIHQWLQENNVDVSDAIVKVKQRFGDFNVGDCPKYHEFLGGEYGLI
jgi:hypothetical protein